MCASDVLFPRPSVHFAARSSFHRCGAIALVVIVHVGAGVTRFRLLLVCCGSNFWKILSLRETGWFWFIAGKSDTSWSHRDVARHAHVYLHHPLRSCILDALYL